MFALVSYEMYTPSSTSGNNYDTLYHIYKRVTYLKIACDKCTRVIPRMRHDVKRTDSEFQYEKYLAFRGDSRVAGHE